MTTAVRLPSVVATRARARRSVPNASTLAAAVIVGLAAAAAILRIVHRGHIDSFFTNGWLAVEVAVALVYAPAGALVLRRGGSRAVGLLFLAAAAGNAVSAFAAEYGSHGLYYSVGSVPEPALVSSLQSWVWLPGNLLLGTLVPLLLPDGRLRPGRIWRWTAVAAVLGTLLRIPDHATNAWPWPLGPPASPLAVTNEGVRDLLGWANGIGMALVLAAAIAGMVSIGMHLRASELARRAQLRWLAAGSAAVALNVLIEPVELITGDFAGTEVAAQVLQVVALPLLPITAAVAVLRHRLWGIDAVIKKTAFWMAATSVLFVLFVSVVTVAGLVLGKRGTAASAVAALVIAVAFDPIRTRLHASVERVIYGERGDPLAVVRRLGSTLRTAAGPDAALQRVTEALGPALNLEMVVIELDEPSGRAPVAQWGADREPDAAFPLSYRGRKVGTLLVGCHRGDEVGSRLRSAIEDLCPHVAAAAAASQFEHDLLRANRRLTTARDDERRRLRRDLHDGLGPALAGMALSLTAARNHLAGGDAARAHALLNEMGAELERKVSEIRAIVYGLRPPQLDDLGLVAAIEHRIRAYRSSSTAVSFRSAELPVLSPAVESAAYYVTVGALDNAVRHSGATTCTVEIVVDESELRVEVADDGSGISGPEGVGIRSMRERASTLGGALMISTRESGGTAVTVELPLAHG